ncbi:MAG: NUDIX domain-containing protein [Bacteriovoracaceae bacterium]
MQKIKRKSQVVILALGPKGLKVLLLRTNKKRGNLWQNVTGSANKGESFTMAALREAKEETGLAYDDIIQMVQLPLAFEFDDRWGKRVYEATFLIVMREVFKPKLDKTEHDKSMWKDCKLIKKVSYGYQTNYETYLEAMKVC